jgi:hypothetical protein
MRLQRLFDRYAGDLERFAPTLRGQFGCPICFTAIRRSVPLREVVAEEHVIPRSLGGRITTLTCKRCNNEAGTTLEAHLVQRVLLEARKRPPRTTVKIGDAVVRAEMVLPETSREPYDIVVIKKQSDERQIAASQRLLKTGKDLIHLGLDFRYIERRSLVALLRAAYLLMFRTFGYRYALYRSAAAVRDEIRQGDRETPILKGIVWRLNKEAPHGTRVTIMTRPRELASFLVLLQLDADRRHVAAVTLPPPGSDGVDLYERIQAQQASTDVAVTPLPEAEGFVPFVEAWRAVVGRPATAGPPRGGA